MSQDVTSNVVVGMGDVTRAANALVVELLGRYRETVRPVKGNRGER